MLRCFVLMMFRRRPRQTEASARGSQNSVRRQTQAKDPPFLNRRRGAMRRRVHQVS